MPHLRQWEHYNFSMFSAVAMLASGVLFAPLPTQAFNSVVAIGRTMPDGSRAWIGSGFLYAYLHRADLKGESRYRSFIVTNRHVLVTLKEVLVRFNPGSLSPETGAEIMTVRLVDADGKQLWIAPSDEALDVGASPWVPPRDMVIRLKHMGFIIGETTIDQTIVAPGSILSRKLRESVGTYQSDTSPVADPTHCLNTGPPLFPGKNERIDQKLLDGPDATTRAPCGRPRPAS